MRPPPGISIRKEPYTADDLARNVARFTVTLTHRCIACGRGPGDGARVDVHGWCEQCRPSERGRA